MAALAHVFRSGEIVRLYTKYLAGVGQGTAALFSLWLHPHLPEHYRLDAMIWGITRLSKIITYIPIA